MSAIRTIRQAPRLSQLVKMEGGLHARTALSQAKAAQGANRDAHLTAIGQSLAWMGEWRALEEPSVSDWEALHEASAGIIGLCDSEADAHLLRAARLLCAYIDRARHGKCSKEIGALFINTLKALADQDRDIETRAAVLSGLEALLPKQNSGA